MGPEAEKSYYDTADAWFSYWLKDEKNEVADWSPVQLFVMGANEWRSENEWPLARTVYTDFYLHSGGRANTAAGDGSLATRPPDRSRPTSSPTTPETRDDAVFSPGPADLGPAVFDGRPDVLMYSTQPLERHRSDGVVEVKLHAASSARDTDFVVKLMDVWPNGFTQELCHGIVRARYRESFENPMLIEPGEVYEYSIRLNPTSNLFKPGHRIRVNITSSDFPNFDRNHNTGGDDYAESTLVSARQTVFHDGGRPSMVILPIIP